MPLVYDSLGQLTPHQRPNWKPGKQQQEQEQEQQQPQQEPTATATTAHGGRDYAYIIMEKEMNKKTTMGRKRDNYLTERIMRHDPEILDNLPEPYMMLIDDEIHVLTPAINILAKEKDCRALSITLEPMENTW